MSLILLSQSFGRIFNDNSQFFNEGSQIKPLVEWIFDCDLNDDNWGDVEVQTYWLVMESANDSIESVTNAEEREIMRARNREINEKEYSYLRYKV